MARLERKITGAFVIVCAPLTPLIIVLMRRHRRGIALVEIFAVTGDIQTAVQVLLHVNDDTQGG